MTEVLTLSTARQGVLLRELSTETDDIAYFQAIDEDREHVDQHGNEVSTKYKSVEDVKKARLEAGNKIRMGIWEDNEFKGSVNATPNEDGNEAEIGYWLRASAVGNGYATLAVRAITNYLSPRYRRVFAEVNINNQSSIKVLERSGYAPSGEVERDWGRAVVLEPAN